MVFIKSAGNIFCEIMMKASVISKMLVVELLKRYCTVEYTTRFIFRFADFLWESLKSIALQIFFSDMNKVLVY